MASTTESPAEPETQSTSNNDNNQNHNQTHSYYSYQQSLLEHYQQQQQLQHSYYYDPLQLHHFNYPFENTNCFQFDPFPNLDPSQQLHSYYQLPSSGTLAFQPPEESLSNQNQHPLSTPFFYDEAPLPQDIVDGPQLSQHLLIPDYQYISQSRQVLGTGVDDRGLHPLSIRRCFNCGDSSHTLVACPEPRNEPLIRLTKQIFQAHSKNEDEQDENTSTHNVQEEGRSRFKQSLNDNLQESVDRRKFLVSTLAPGLVSNTLREALFWERTRGEPDENYLDPSRPMPWFQSMEKWGYPPSYAIDPTTTRNPSQVVLERLNALEQDQAWDTVEILEMHEERLSDHPSTEEEEDTDEEEEEILKMLVPGYEARGRRTIPLPPENTNHLENVSFPDSNSLPPLPETLVPLKKLVQYRGGNFSSDRLPIYNGQLISTRSYLDQYSNGSNHYSNRRSDHHHQQHQRPRRSRSSSPSSKARWSPYSNSYHLRTDSPPNTHSMKNSSRIKKDDEVTGSKAYTQRWKDAALNFAATQQKVTSAPAPAPAPAPTSIITNAAQSHNGGGSSNGSRNNRFYIDPDAPASNQEQTSIHNEELNYSDDVDHHHRHPTRMGRRGSRNYLSNHKEEPILSNKRRKAAQEYNYAEGEVEEEEEERNGSNKAAETTTGRCTTTIEKRPHNNNNQPKKKKQKKKNGNGILFGGGGSTTGPRRETPMMMMMNRRKITNAYQEDDVFNDLSSPSTSFQFIYNGGNLTKGHPQSLVSAPVTTNTNTTTAATATAHLASTIPTPPLPNSPPPIDVPPPPLPPPDL